MRVFAAEHALEARPFTCVCAAECATSTSRANPGLRSMRWLCGTVLTMNESLGNAGAIRRDGRIVAVPSAFDARMIPFTATPMHAVTIPWGGASTAFRSTGIRNVRVHKAMSEPPYRALKFSRWFGWLQQSDFMQRRLSARVRAGPSSDFKLRRGRTVRTSCSKGTGFLEATRGSACRSSGFLRTKRWITRTRERSCCRCLP